MAFFKSVICKIFSTEEKQIKIEGCIKCHNLQFEYDSYFSEYICKECGWTVDQKPNGNINITSPSTSKNQTVPVDESGAAVPSGSLKDSKKLCNAASTGDVSMVKQLLNKGVSANVIVKGEELPDWDSYKGIGGNNHSLMNPLSCATQNGYLSIVKLLISSGADINITDERNVTALYLAADRGHLDIVRCLVTAGADCNIIGPTGETPIFKAVRYGATGEGRVDYQLIIHELILAGTDLQIKDNFGLTCINMANQLDTGELGNLIKGAGKFTEECSGKLIEFYELLATADEPDELRPAYAFIHNDSKSKFKEIHSTLNPEKNRTDNDIEFMLLYSLQILMLGYVDQYDGIQRIEVLSEHITEDVASITILIVCVNGERLTESIILHKENTNWYCILRYSNDDGWMFPWNFLPLPASPDELLKNW